MAEDGDKASASAGEAGGGGGGKEGGEEEKSVKLFVGQVPKHMTEADLLAMFREVAAVDEVTVIKDKVTKVSRGADLPGPRIWTGLAILLPFPAAALARFAAMPAALFPRSRLSSSPVLGPRWFCFAWVWGAMPHGRRNLSFCSVIRQICSAFFYLFFFLLVGDRFAAMLQGDLASRPLVGGVSAWIRVY